MAKVFRLHTGAADTISNWDSSVKIGTKAIDSIPDPIGANDKHEITSIPSPFARMDLVKRAFKIVAESGLDGNTIYHKLVSDCLDVGQIFFNIEKFRDKIEIIVWDKRNCLAELAESDYEEHRRLGQTYKTYFEQDADEYNFNEMDCIYLLNYIDPSAPNEINIIGATSPATVFFTSANNLEYVGKKIKFGNDSPFDSEYKPLYKRNFEYIKYWWSLKMSRTDFPRIFPEVDLYLNKCFNCLSDEQRRDLRQNIIDKSFYEGNYDEISVNPTQQQYVTVLSEKLRQKRPVSNISSGFEMKISASLHRPGQKIPLALPIETYTERTMYVESYWNKNTYVPYFDSRPIANRTLPDDGSKYPYVTVGDFLEDSVVEIPYKFNTDGFFNGNDEAPESRNSYLLPLKSAYFDYFTTSDLMEKINGKNRIEICRLNGGAVKVILRIPIKDGGYIQYEKIYYKDAKSDTVNNKGCIVERRFTLGLYPGIKYPENIKPYYRMSLLDRNSVFGPDNAYTMNFYNQKNELIPSDGVVYRNRNTDSSRYESAMIDSVTYAIEKDFQYVSIQNEENSSIRGVIIPKFTARNGGRKFRFAIDLGTTNTHIEYCIDGSSPNSFDISDKEKQIQKMHITPDDFDVNSVFASDFIPEFIGKGSAYSYPMRTVLSETNNTNWDKAVLSMANVNIPFTYEKVMSLPYNVIHTDLKWSTKSEDKQRAAKYIESLLLMLRTKVLLNNGDLSKTEIVWFYPASMTQNRFNKFRDEWRKKFVSLFGSPEENIIAVSESVAPYYYHKARSGTTSTVVSVDIGGGTTDVLIVDKGEPKYLTSFRFAANTIFGDGYSYDSNSNGFVNHYKDAIMSQFETNNLGILKEVFGSVLDKHVSTDIIAFLFSLASNQEIEKELIEIDFLKMLADDSRGKYVVILFYVAIIYHIANLMKAKGFDKPRHITFSGNGSKVLNILSTNDATLANFTKLIFEEVYGDKYSIDGLDIIRPTNSKESTCKGGIIMSPFKSQDYSEIKEMKTILVGSDAQTFAGEQMTYNDLNESLLEQVVESVKTFLEFAFDLNKKFSFYDNFDIDRSIMDRVKNLCCKDIMTYLNNGISLKKNEIVQDGADENLEESLFFYPLVGIINAVVRNVYKL